jgi:hypothetical protein
LFRNGRFRTEMPRNKKIVPLSALGLDADLLARFEDFQQGFYGGDEKQLVAAAIELFMKETYGREPEVKRRAEEARQRRKATK